MLRRRRIGEDERFRMTVSGAYDVHLMHLDMKPACALERTPVMFKFGLTSIQDRKIAPAQ
ncbi:hypothetical protein BD414DRAFT_498471 [Trametes punicea]|nr:hypothetical protein BD414DRAFT_498471 [Trametes punicea]